MTYYTELVRRANEIAAGTIFVGSKEKQVFAQNCADAITALMAENAEMAELRRMYWELRDERDEARNATLEEAATLIESGKYEPTMGSRLNRCVHGQWLMGVDCVGCAAEAIRSLKT